MISINNICKRYNQHTALDDINLTVSKGCILGLLGPNGAGKTTLVSILNGLTPYQSGTISIFGLSLHDNLPEIRRRSSFIPQSFAFYENLTVMENLRFFAGIQNIKNGQAKNVISQAIAINRLEAMLNKRANSLSGGQKQRLNIAIGLLNNPEVIYLDEPTAGIDPELRNSILQTIRSFKDAGKTIIYTSHYMQEIEQICDEVAIIRQGRIICHETIEKLLNKENGTSNLETIFLQLTASEEAPC
ncbi:MAG: ABC transporter ATP-binding protein [Thermodesulfobacteriota bacterium]|nr:ABC transporter ATP-binding protein [Thermodesulfobacteriota bacterium]